jgi:hypothetical protein
MIQLITSSIRKLSIVPKVGSFAKTKCFFKPEVLSASSIFSPLQRRVTGATPACPRDPAPGLASFSPFQCRVTSETPDGPAQRTLTELSVPSNAG